MKWNGSSGVQGATQDVKLEQCRLAGIVFLGAIVVTDGSKSEKRKKEKKRHTRRNRRRRVAQKRVKGKKWPSRVFKEAWNTSRFTGAKDPSLRRRHATQRRSVVLRCGEDILHSGKAWFVAAMAYPRSGKACFAAAD